MFNQKSLFSFFISFCRRYWIFFFFATCFLIGTHLIQTELPFHAKKIAALIKEEKGANILLWPYLLMALGIILFRTLSRCLFFYPARHLQKELKLSLLERIVKADPESYKHLYNPGQLFQIIQNDIDQIRAFLGFVFLQSANIIIAVVIITPRLSEIHPQLLWALSPIFISVVILLVVLNHYSKVFYQHRIYQGETQNFLMESYLGKETINGHNSEKEFSLTFSRKIKKELDEFFKGSVGSSLVVPLNYLAPGISLLLGAWIIFDNKGSGGDLIIFSGLVFLLQGPLLYISWIGIVTTGALASWKRVRELADILIHSGKENVDSLMLWERPLEISLKEGRKNIIVGPTGHGKSYLLEKLALKAIREGKKVSAVLQSPHLFNGTIRENLFLGEKKNEERARELLKVFDLNHLVSENHDILDLEVGENGKRLSGGQVKRLSLVRSLLVDADYYFWDDPFSSVDFEFEKLFFKKYDVLFNGKTFVLTSHRLTTFTFSDCYYLIEKERGIVETGQVDDIKNKKKKVYEFFKLQLV